MRNILPAFTLIGTIYLSGCGAVNGPQIVHGSISVGGQSPNSGEVRFVPIEGTGGSINAAVIVDGEYRIEGRGGVPIGKYRVEIIAKQKTAKKVRRYNGFEMAMVDEQIPISPPIYAGTNSPLIQEVSLNGDDKIDFNLPEM